MAEWGLLRGHRAIPDDVGRTCIECGTAVRIFSAAGIRPHFRHVQPRRPLSERLWSRVKKGDGCWEWQGQTNATGYGVINVDGSPRLAHRIAWAVTYGPPPVTRDVCHACDNPPCVRPDHLWLGTRKQNMVDASVKGRLAVAERKATCKRGHPLSGENVYPRNGRRHCRTCRHEYKVAYNRRHRVPELATAAAERMQEALG